MAGSLPVTASRWYFHIGGILAGLTALLALATIPRSMTVRRNKDVSMDWLGSCLIVTGMYRLESAISSVAVHLRLLLTSSANRSHPSVLWTRSRALRRSEPQHGRLCPSHRPGALHRWPGMSCRRIICRRMVREMSARSIGLLQPAEREVFLVGSHVLLRVLRRMAVLHGGLVSQISDSDQCWKRD